MIDTPHNDEISIVAETDVVSEVNEVIGGMFTWMHNPENADINAEPNPIKSGSELPSKNMFNKDTSGNHGHGHGNGAESAPKQTGESKQTNSAINTNNRELLEADEIVLDLEDQQTGPTFSELVEMETDKQLASLDHRNNIENCEDAENIDGVDEDSEGEDNNDQDSDEEGSVDENIIELDNEDTDCENEDTDCEDDNCGEDDNGGDTDCEESINHENGSETEATKETGSASKRSTGTPNSSSNKKSSPKFNKKYGEQRHRINEPKEVVDRKRELLLELDLMRENRGIKLTKKLSIDDPLDVIEYEHARYTMNKELDGKMKWIKTVLNGGAMFVQFANAKFAPKMQASSFAKDFSQKLDENEHIVYALAKRFCRKSSSSPIQEIMMLYITVFVTSCLQSNFGNVASMMASSMSGSSGKHHANGNHSGKNHSNQNFNQRDAMFNGGYGINPAMGMPYQQSNYGYPQQWSYGYGQMHNGGPFYQPNFQQPNFQQYPIYHQQPNFQQPMFQQPNFQQQPNFHPNYGYEQQQWMNGRMPQQSNFHSRDSQIPNSPNQYTQTNFNSTPMNTQSPVGFASDERTNKKTSKIKETNNLQSQESNSNRQQQTTPRSSIHNSPTSIHQTPVDQTNTQQIKKRRTFRGPNSAQ